MKYCAHCGKELFDEAIICPGCGCAAEITKKKVSKERKWLSTKQIVLIASIAVAVVVAIIGGLFIRNYIRTEEVKQRLAGHTFLYRENATYASEWAYYSFDEDAKCTRAYYYTFMDESNLYETDYTIHIKGDKVYLECSIYTLRIEYDSDGDIEALYDVQDGEYYYLNDGQTFFKGD